MTEVWYRAVDTQYAGPADDDGISYGDPGPIGIVIEEYEVLKHTPCGVIIKTHDFDHPKRFVSRKTTKQFACPTKEAALQSLLARRTRQASIYRARARGIDNVVVVVADMLEKNEEKAYVQSYNFDSLKKKHKDRKLKELL